MRLRSELRGRSDELRGRVLQTTVASAGVGRGTAPGAAPWARKGVVFVFFQAEDGIRDLTVTSSDVCSSDLLHRSRQPGLLAPSQFHHLQLRSLTDRFSAR